MRIKTFKRKSGGWDITAKYKGQTCWTVYPNNELVQGIIAVANKIYRHVQKKAG
jgi:hypothetical protein